ncbi:MAG: UDP-2,3-diacylglucosamine diphosphatase LpxI [Bauldia sp.]|uniref:LpxI family protein n=1 Tax=Bauldia sp. TaxID=2575872 RepID=UPI001D8614FA|nr:UDP-2,3-diacylglucosamine diphosphatase LpxI [Bauldia sp.]MCB1495690.1 UDP-2,3-diacylglucosamine diphosphatase LpxI [Bauldia sp.]
MAVTEGEPIGIVAGGGSVPLHVAEAALRAGRKPFIVAIDGEAEEGIAAYPHEVLKWGQIGRMQSVFVAHGVKELVMIGNIRIRPDFSKFKLDLGAIRVIPKVLALLKNGDADLLSGVVTIMGELGFTVIGAHEIAPELVATEGPLGRHKPDTVAGRDIARAMRAARAIGVIDAGQAAVAINGRVVAMEAAEGTDGMIDRVGALRRAGRLKWSGRRGVLAKCAKPQQDLRVDMPTIGPKTVRAAAEAGLAGIAVETGRVMIVDRDDVIELADRAGLFIAGETSRADVE